MRPVDDDSARVMRRHYDDLEAAPQQVLSWEESEDSGSCSDTERDVIRERPQSALPATRTTTHPQTADGCM